MYDSIIIADDYVIPHASILLRKRRTCLIRFERNFSEFWFHTAWAWHTIEWINLQMLKHILKYFFQVGVKRQLYKQAIP